MMEVGGDGPVERMVTPSDRSRLVEAVLARRDALVDRIVQSLREDIVDYGSLRALTLTDDVRATAIATTTDLLESLLDSSDSPTRDLEVIRRSAARRVHQEVSLPSLLHSYRIWGSIVWRAILEEAGEDPVARDAALQLVSRIFDYIDRVSVTVAQVYLEEAAGAYRSHDVLRSDVLEALLRGRAHSERARVEVARLNLSTANRVAVVLVRLTDVAPESLRAESLAVLQACREVLIAKSRTLLGVRESDVVCIVRIARATDWNQLVESANALASLNATWRVCIGRPHLGLEGVPRSFREAQEAAVVSASVAPRGKPVLFSEVMLDRILIHSEYAEDLIEEFLRPLVRYDTKHGGSLLPTLRAYVESDLNLTRAAHALTVSPNTVAYRIKRIGEITGQDLQTVTGVVTLSLALRLLDG